MQTSIVFVRAHSLVFFIIAVASLFSVMAIAFADIISGDFAVAPSSNVTITQLNISKPNNVAQGDLLLANVAVNGGDQAAITPPTGWTLVLRTDNEANISIASYWKLASAYEPASYMWTINSQTRAVGGITRYSGVDSANPIDVSAGNTGRSNTAIAPSITTTLANAQIVTTFAFPAGAGSGNHFSTPTGMTEKYDTSNPPFGPSIASDDVIQAIAGSSGTKSSSIGSAPRDWVAQQIALRPAVALTMGLTHYWKLDESSGNAVDSIGSLTLTNNNSVPYVTGKINNAADLEDANQHYFSTTNDMVASEPSAYSACAWFNLESVPPGESNNDTILISYDTNLVFQLYYYYDNGTLQLRYDHGAGDGHGRLAIYNVDLQTGIWHHVCGTWNDSNMTLYLDGISVATQAASGIATGITNGTQVGASFGPSALFDGKIDEVGLWTRALSVSEIAQLYNSGSGLQYPF